MIGGRLQPDDVQAIAHAVVELLRDEQPAPTPRLLDAAEVAARFSVDRGWVYDHADALGAVWLGTGPKARLRFDPEKVTAALSAFDAGKGAGAPAPAPRRRSRRRTPRASGTGLELLPVRGVTSTR